MYHSAQKIESRTKTAVILSTNVDISSAEKPRLQATWSKQTLVCLAKSLKFKFTDLVRTALISYKLHKTLVQLSYTINSYNYMYYCTKTLQYFIVKANVDCPSQSPHALNSDTKQTLPVRNVWKQMQVLRITHTLTEWWRHAASDVKTESSMLVGRLQHAEQGCYVALSGWSGSPPEHSVTVKNSVCAWVANSRCCRLLITYILRLK